MGPRRAQGGAKGPGSMSLRIQLLRCEDLPAPRRGCSRWHRVKDAFHHSAAYSAHFDRRCCSSSFLSVSAPRAVKGTSEAAGDLALNWTCDVLPEFQEIGQWSNCAQQLPAGFGRWSPRQSDENGLQTLDCCMTALADAVSLISLALGNSIRD